MSTDLYGIRVLEVDPSHARLRLRVFVVYYDVNYSSHQPLPYDRSFFMRVLCDKDALEGDVTQNDYLDESFVNRNAFRYVKRFETLETRNEPVTSYEGLSDFYYERDGGWSDEESLVQGDYDVFVTNPDYLAAFSVGDSWGTTSYVTDSDDLALDDYKGLPDLDNVALILSPFLDRDRDSTNVESMALSPDGSMLACTNDESTLRVFSIPSGEQILEAKDVTQWWGGVGWTLDGVVAMGVKGGHNKVDLSTGDVTFVAYEGYPAHPSGTRFFHNPMDADSVYIKDAHGKVLYEHAHEESYTAYVSFDASGDFALLALEHNGLFFVDISAGTSTPIEAPSLQGLTFNHVALSPDARYIISEIQGTSKGLQVVERSTGKILREQPWAGYLLNASWSMDNRLVAAGYCDQNGFNTRLYVYRTGQEVDAFMQQDVMPISASTRGDTAEVLGTLATLFVEKTAGFASGWDTHLDDTLSTYHLALVRCGSKVDVVPYMNDEVRQVDTRARESIEAAKRADTARAEQALEDAHARLQDIRELSEWSYPIAHGMLCAADYIQGHTRRAHESFEVLRQQISNESEHIPMLIHVALLMGKDELVHELILAHPHDRFEEAEGLILKILSNEGRMDLFTLMVNHCALGIEDGWNAVEEIQQILCHVGESKRAYLLEGFDLDIAKPDDHNVWLKWFALDPEAALHQLSIDLLKKDLSTNANALEFFARPDQVMAREDFDVGDIHVDSLVVGGLMRSSNPQAGIAYLVDVGFEDIYMLRDLAMMGAFELIQSTEYEAGLPPELAPILLAIRGDHDGLRAHLKPLKRARRSALYPDLARIAWLRGDTSLALDFSAKMRFGDMNAPGIHAVQQAFIHVAGAAYQNLNS